MDSNGWESAHKSSQNTYGGKKGRKGRAKRAKMFSVSLPLIIGMVSFVVYMTPPLSPPSKLSGVWMTNSKLTLYDFIELRRGKVITHTRCAPGTVASSEYRARYRQDGDSVFVTYEAPYMGKITERYTLQNRRKAINGDGVALVKWER